MGGNNRNLNPFQSSKNLLTVYDYESEAVEAMIDISAKRGARISSAEFSWPRMRIQFVSMDENGTRKWLARLA